MTGDKQLMDAIDQLIDAHFQRHERSLHASPHEGLAEQRTKDQVAANAVATARQNLRAVLGAVTRGTGEIGPG